MPRYEIHIPFLPKGLTTSSSSWCFTSWCIQKADSETEHSVKGIRQGVLGVDTCGREEEADQVEGEVSWDAGLCLGSSGSKQCGSRSPFSDRISFPPEFIKSRDYLCL